MERDKFLNRRNIEHYRKPLDARADQDQRRMIVGLLAEEEGKLEAEEGQLRQQIQETK